MAGTRLRTNHRSRVDWWRAQFQRHEKADLSVTEFCRQLGVSVTTFYYWKKRVHEPMPYASAQSPAEHRSRHVTTSVVTTPANFVPVSILEPALGTELDIELANACVLRLKGVIDPLLLTAAIAAAGRLAGSHEGAN
jgi:hypothetical protein